MHPPVAIQFEVDFNSVWPKRKIGAKNKHVRGKNSATVEAMTTDKIAQKTGVKARRGEDK